MFLVGCRAWARPIHMRDTEVHIELPAELTAEGHPTGILGVVAGLATVGRGLATMAFALPLLVVTVVVAGPLSVVAGIAHWVLSLTRQVGGLIHAAVRGLTDPAIVLGIGIFVTLFCGIVGFDPSQPAWCSWWLLGLWVVLGLPALARLVGAFTAYFDDIFDEEPLDQELWTKLGAAADQGFGLLTLWMVYLRPSFRVWPVHAPPQKVAWIVGVCLSVAGVGCSVLEDLGRQMVRREVAASAMKVALRLPSRPVECPYCGDGFEGVTQVACSTCWTPHHQDCWREAGSCTTYSCAGRKAVEVQRRA